MKNINCIVNLLGFSEKKCTGCRSCEQICPAAAITFYENLHGFSMPFVDDRKCINCGKCQRACHLFESQGLCFVKQNLSSYAVKAKESEIRMKSSSGGVFYLLAKKIIEQNGIVYGVAFDDSYVAKHIRVSQKTDLEKLYGSKYVQSELGHTFTDIERDLLEKKNVLFSGTPCQVAALQSYINLKEINSTNLILIEVVCHGVPSPLVWNKYLASRMPGVNPSEFRNIFFRHKKDGWHARSKVRIAAPYFSNSCCDSYLYEDSDYNELFLSNLTLRECCHECHYARAERTADITLCDFWGIENTELKKFDDDKGISGVVINSEKGMSLWNEIKDGCEAIETLYNLIVKNQQTMKAPFARPENKDFFWTDFYTKSFDDVAQKYVNPEYRIRTHKFTVVASDGSGSKGDEGMLRGVLELLNYEDILLISPNEIYPCTDSLLDLKQNIDEICVSHEYIADVIKNKTTLVIVGADVIDGTCGVEYSLSRIEAMKKALSLGGKVFCFSSFRSNVDEKIINGLKELLSNGNAHFFVRDEVSVENFESQLNASVEFFPDFAFFCSRNLSSSVQNIKDFFSLKKSDGYSLVGINFSTPSFNSFYKEKTLENRIAYIKNTVSIIKKYEDKVFFVLLGNDVREWEGHLSDSSYQQLASNCLDSLSSNDYYIVPPEISYPELLELLSGLDYIISARMHLSIAAMRCGTIPIVYTGNGSTGTFSMSEKVAGMFRSRFGRDDLLATNSEELEKAINLIKTDGESLKKILLQKNKENSVLEQNYAKTFKEFLGVSNLNAKKKFDEVFIAKKTIRENRNMIYDLIAQKNSEIVQKNSEIAQKNSEINSLKDSTSWKITAPLRFFKRGVKKIYKMIVPHKLQTLVYILRHYGFKGAVYEIKKKMFDKRIKTYKPVVIHKVSYEPIEIPKFDTVLVSIIIPVYNQFDYTYKCISSIVNTVKGISYEIIIGDDMSTDRTKDIEKYFQNIRVNRNKNDHGFLMNCNRASKLARGKYILFLNNDTQVQEGWLSSLVELIERDDKIGMVGSKLVYPNGTLQEAGGIIWSDASAWNYGHGKNPELPEYNYVKEVDYISGASIMIRSFLWNEIGGFDERYKPAYYEDSDLAFEVRKCGYKVMYQPKSVVVHFEGISNGTNLSSGLKKYQVENRDKFVTKWSRELRKQSAPDCENSFLARDRSQGKKVVLIIDHYVPTFDKDAGSRTTFQYIKMFISKGYSVKFVGDNFACREMEPYMSTILQMGVEVLYGLWYSRNILGWIKSNKDKINFVYLNRPHISEKYIDFIRSKTNIKIIYYGHDLHFLRMQREADLIGDKNLLLDAKKWQKREFDVMRKAAVVYYPSVVEEKAIKAIDSSINVKAIHAYLFDTDNLESKYDAEKRKGIMFVGGFSHTPNIDAVKWFAENIFPKIHEKNTNVSFYIVGSNAPDEIKKMDGDGIVFKGFVTDKELKELYEKSRIVVVPLRYGAGVKGKVIEALYNGLPVITTSIGAEGINDIENVAEIHDEENDFANAVLSLYDDFEKLETMSRKSLNLIKKDFSIEAAWNVIKEDFE